MKTTRIPHAPGTPLPELDEFLEPFRVLHFSRSEGAHALEHYVTGLLTDHPNKNCDTIASVVPATSEQSLQGLLTEMVWDEDDLNRQRVRRGCSPCPARATPSSSSTTLASPSRASPPSASSVSIRAP